MKLIPPALLLLAVWLYAVGRPQLAPTPELLQDASRWQAHLLELGLCQVGAVLLLWLAFWRAGRRRWLAAWLGTSWIVGFSWWLTTTLQMAHLHLAVAAAAALLGRPLLLLPLVLVPGGWAGLIGAFLGTGLGGLYNWAAPQAKPGFFHWRTLVTVVSLWLTWVGLKPGEEFFNRWLLLAAQKKGVSLTFLAAPNPLPAWVARLGDVCGLTADDLAMLPELQRHPGPGLVLSPSWGVEPPAPSRLLAALAGRPAFAGWNGQELTAAAKLLREGRMAWRDTGLEFVLLRGPHQPPELTLLKKIGDTALYAVPPGQANPASLEILGTPAPGAELALRSAANGTAELESPLPRLALTQGENRVPLPLTPGNYTLGNTSMHLQLPATLALLQVELSAPLGIPSRSLVTVNTTWHNGSSQPIDLAAFQGARLSSGPLPCPIQRLSGRVEPGQTLQLPLIFSTPEQEGNCAIEVELVEPDGGVHKVGTGLVRTRRRLPPVGF